MTDPLYPKYNKVPSPIILWRDGYGDEIEWKAVNKYFVTTKTRMDPIGNDLVIGRYSVLPFFKELERDLNCCGAKLINSYREHLYAADLQNWYIDLQAYTPKTWFKLEDVPDNIGPVILKGSTNSRKHKFNSLMFANNKKEAIEVFMRLMDDEYIAEQGIYIREFVPLNTYMSCPISGLPITEEFRIFVLDGKIMSRGFYWSSYLDQLQSVPDASTVPLEFLSKVIDKVKDNIRFFTIDVAKTKSGEWIVVEINDGMMSGLSENDPYVLYKNMKYELWDSKQQR